MYANTLRLIIQAVGRICRCRNKNKNIYLYSDKEVIERIEKCNIRNISNGFKTWKNSTDILTSEVAPEGKYFVNIEDLNQLLNS